MSNFKLDFRIVLKDKIENDRFINYIAYFKDYWKYENRCGSITYFKEYYWINTKARDKYYFKKAIKEAEENFNTLLKNNGCYWVFDKEKQEPKQQTLI